MSNDYMLFCEVCEKEFKKDDLIDIVIIDNSIIGGYYMNKPKESHRYVCRNCMNKKGGK